MNYEQGFTGRVFDKPGMQGCHTGTVLGETAPDINGAIYYKVQLDNGNLCKLPPSRLEKGEGEMPAVPKPSEVKKSKAASRVKKEPGVKVEKVKKGKSDATRAPKTTIPDGLVKMSDAERAGLPISKSRDMAHKGELGARQIGRSYYFDKSKLEAFLASK